MLSVVVLGSCAAAPKIVFDAPIHDFGTRITEPEMKHSFHFKNAGDAVLIVENVKTSCGCTGALSSSKEIQPGGTSTIDIVYKPGKSIGPVSKTITVVSNDPESPSTVLTIKAVIETHLSLKPDRVYFGQVHRKEKKDQIIEFIGKEISSVTLKSIDLKPIDHQPDKPESAQAPIPMASIRNGFTWKIDDSVQNSVRSLKVNLTLDASTLAPGPYNDTLIIETDSVNVPKFEIPVTCEVLGNITVSPQRVMFQLTDTSSKEEFKTITIRSSDETKFRIRNATCSDPIISVRNLDQLSSHIHTLDIVIGLTTSSERMRGDVKLETDNPEQPQIIVPVTMFRSKSPQSANPAASKSLRIDSSPETSDTSK